MLRVNLSEAVELLFRYGRLVSSRYCWAQFALFSVTSVDFVTLSFLILDFESVVFGSVCSVAIVWVPHVVFRFV